MSYLDTPIKVEVLTFINETYPVGQRQEIMDNVRAMLTPARVYLGKQRLKHDSALKVADLAEYVIPMRARQLLLRPNLDDSNAARDRFKNHLKLIPLVPRASLEEPEDANQRALSLKRTSILAEVDDYLTVADGVSLDFNLVEFWVAHKVDLPNLFDFFVIIGTLQASSAFAERVLSRYQRRFGDANIKDAKEDYIEASIMAEVNDPDFLEALRIEALPIDNENGDIED